MSEQNPSASNSNEKNIHYSQKGIPFFPDYGHFLTVFVKNSDKDIRALWLEVVSAVNAMCDSLEQKTVCVCGVDYNLWTDWCRQFDMPVPCGITSHEKLKIKPFMHTGGDFWFHIKGDDAADCQSLSDTIRGMFEPVLKEYTQTIADKRLGGKVFAGRFQDAMINPVDPINLSERSIVGNEDAFYRGSAYVIQQKFKHNWARLDNMNMVEKENMIGRSHDDTIIPMPDDRSHIKCVRQLNGERITQRILRQALTYGEAKEGGGKEEGVYFAAYANDGHVYEELMQNIMGTEEGFIKDKMLSNTHSESGNFWFIPQASLLNLEGTKDPVDVPLNDFYNRRSRNGFMFYNNRDFLHKAKQTNGTGEDEISDRIMILLGQTFSRWNDTWQKKVVMPSPGHLKNYLDEPHWKSFQSIGDSESAALRKGLAIKISLSDVLQRQQYRDQALLFNIKPYEIIVGNLPPLTLGTGSQVMEYLSQDEKIQGFFGMLNEYSATGHNIPNYHKVLNLGIPGLINEAETYLKTASVEKKDFYQSTLWALEGLQSFVKSYAELAEKLKSETPESDESLRQCYGEIAQRMQRLATQKPDGFLDSLQLIFIVNCALHQIGEPMSIGRLDQYLIKSYEKDLASGKLDSKSAQEMLDAFWLKMDETVLYNRQHMEDYLTYGTGAVFYSAGNFPQGSALNQWVQQVTLGGYLPTNDEQPTDGCNPVTLLSLRSSRRLPLNAPCLSLRVHKNMDQPIHKEIIAEASKAILSGGAHPILINDDKLCKALAASGPLSVADSRDYVCDGCYEPIIGGKSEWAFSYVPILPVVGMAMNQGATIEGAGWVHLRGLKNGWNSPPPEEIATFEQFMDIFYTQYKWQISGFFNTLMNSYGALSDICPSPLFSSMTDGCMESGRDMTNGGAECHIVAPMMCGIANAINSLYAIKKMAYDPETNITSLVEIRQALFNNWGNNMQEPFQNILAGQARAESVATRYKELRQHALSLPKFGEGKSEELKDFAAEVVGKCVEIIRKGIDEPLPSVKKAYDKLKEKYSQDGREFAFTVTPGVGTFEDNLGLGVTMGASSDGRLSGDPIADDFCAAPSPSDRPPQSEPYDVFTSLNDWNVDSINFGLSNAAPIDLNIDEDFSLPDLERVIRMFASSELGSNLITVTTADPDTYQQAQAHPEKYDLVRVRQGGWSEFYIAMFPEHQRYIPRRPYYSAKK
jgi:Dyp-type peroxidase family